MVKPSPKILFLSIFKSPPECENEFFSELKTSPRLVGGIKRLRQKADPKRVKL